MDDGRIIHAGAVAIGGAGLLILGPSGAGKSALALALMAWGAVLVADDRTRLWRAGERVMADAPEAIRGRIEARGVGILQAEAAGPVALSLVVDLGRTEDQRLPPLRRSDVLGVSLPLVLGPMRADLAPALRQVMLGGRLD